MTDRIQNQIKNALVEQAYTLAEKRLQSQLDEFQINLNSYLEGKKEQTHISDELLKYALKCYIGIGDVEAYEQLLLNEVTQSIQNSMKEDLTLK